jgi:elongation factor 2
LLAHRRPDQIIPAVRRCLLASLHMAEPRVLEPIFLVDIECPTRMIGKVYATLNKRRGQINEENELSGTTLSRIRAFLPVNESFGFTDELRRVTSGTAFPQCQFDHWALLPGEPFEMNTKCGQIITDIRLRKSLSEQIPPLESLIDRQ